MISLLGFTLRETTRATNRHMLDTPWRYLAANGKTRGHRLDLNGRQ